MVTLCLERYLRGPKFEQLQQAIAANELKPSTPNTPPHILHTPGTAVSVIGRQVSSSSHQSSSYDRRSSLTKQYPDELMHSMVPVMEVKKSIPDLIEKGDAEALANRKLIMARDSLETKLTRDVHDDFESIVDEEDGIPMTAEAANLSAINKHKYYVEPVLTEEMEAAIRMKWISILGVSDVKIIVAQIRKFSPTSGLGISLEGTVDVEGGREVRPHHYIRSILPEGPVGKNGLLQSADELLEVNGQRLLGMNHLEVVAILKELPQDVRMVCGRDQSEMVPFTEENICNALGIDMTNSGNLDNILPSSDRLVKAKSDGSLATRNGNDDNFMKMKSRSLEPLTGLAMWSSEPQIIELLKGERGLGFSILDYQDPLDSNDTLIVIRSLVPGGVAQIDGRLIPGDRLLFVNEMNLENASLDQAVQALKGAPKGVVRIGVAKPLPMATDSSSMDKSTTTNETGINQSYIEKILKNGTRESQMDWPSK